MLNISAASERDSQQREGMEADQVLPRDVEIRGRCSEVEGCPLAAGPQSHSCDLQELQAAAQVNVQLQDRVVTISDKPNIWSSPLGTRRGSQS